MVSNQRQARTGWRLAAFGALAFALAGCLMSRAYDQPMGQDLTVAKRNVMISGYENRVEVEGETFVFEGPLAHEQHAYAVRYMGLDSRGNPVLQVIATPLARTDVPVELAETDRMHLSGYGIPPITVQVVNATDELLTYRLRADGPFKATVQ
ncbi:MAG TPA: hypothetical protein VGB88_02280 [Alphaproteobacteria bacterium]